jgi:enamine deaminase RidA (YjgF/YER057c/UK114 family)
VAARATPYLRVVWIGALLFIAGIALDQRWHATHDEFEGTSQQFEAPTGR